MARRLVGIRTHERHRGPTVVLAHDGHLRLERSTWDPGDPDRAWSWASAGAIVAAVHGEEYVVLDGPDEVPAVVADDDAPTVTDLAAALLALPGVHHLRADEAAGAPAVAHGDWFFYARPDDRLPFATIVVGDYPGDETSRLDRPGVFRLNLAVGRDEMPGPADPAELDRFLPHPVYAAQGWVAVLDPSAARWAEIGRLARIALARARGVTP